MEPTESRSAWDLGAGNWIQTYSGRMFRPFAPLAADVELVDIAHALAYTGRFGGHAERFYCVAQHSLHVSELVRDLGQGTAAELEALMHDAAEAYIGDMMRPIKVAMPEFKALENSILTVIAERFHMRPPARWAHAAIGLADEIALATEARDLMKRPPAPWNLRAPADPMRAIIPYGHEHTCRLFLERFEALASQYPRFEWDGYRAGLRVAAMGGAITREEIRALEDLGEGAPMEQGRPS